MKFSPLTLFLLPALATAQTQEECEERFALIVKDLDFKWQNPLGGVDVVIGGGGNDVEWGVPSPDFGNGMKSGLNTMEAERFDVDGNVMLTSEDEMFLLGTVTHKNFGILAAGAINGIELVVMITAELPAGDTEFSFTYHMTVDETPNIPNPSCLDNNNPCPDIVQITVDASPINAVTIGGVTFEIDLLGFTVDGVTALSFVSQENELNSAELLASLVVKGCTTTSGGDPHFQTFSGHWYDFHGACDMHLLNAPHFAPAMPLAIDVRTRSRDWYSFISNAVIQIGDDKLEVGSWGQYIFNGVDVGNMNYPTELAGYELFFSKPDKNTRLVEIVIDGQEKLAIRSFKDMISVKIDKADKERFHGSSGLMGLYDNGAVYTREGMKLLSDPNEIAREWQVRPDEDMLFQVEQEPKFPEFCVMPKKQPVGGRLGKAIAQKQAEEACAHWGEVTRQGCVFDVMKTGDVELAAVAF